MRLFDKQTLVTELDNLQTKKSEDINATSPVMYV